MRMVKYVLILCVVFVLAGCVSACAAEGAYDLSDILYTAETRNDGQRAISEQEKLEKTKVTGEPEPDDTPIPTELKPRTFFEGVLFGSGIAPKTHCVYLDETLVIHVPDDWWETEIENTICAFSGKDREGNHASVAVNAVYESGMTIEDLEAGAKEGIAWSRIEANGIRYFTALTGSGLVTSWLSDEGTVYRLTASHESKAAEASEKLLNDLHQILCRIRTIHESERELLNTMNLLANSDLSEEDPVSFHDAEFERMFYTAIGREKENPVYPSELAAISYLNIRSGNMLFSPEVQECVRYDQPGILDLFDLKLFPNLVYVSITDMKCSGFEALTELPNLRHLILIHAGVTDCSFLSGMELEELNLARNDISDFEPIAAVKGLKELNVFCTGLESLEFTENMDLDSLIAGNNPFIYPGVSPILTDSSAE